MISTGRYHPSGTIMISNKYEDSLRFRNTGLGRYCYVYSIKLHNKIKTAKGQDRRLLCQVVEAIADGRDYRRLMSETKNKPLFFRGPTGKGSLSEDG